jgi:hypothetical protein
LSIIKRSFTRLKNSQVKEMEEPRMTLSNNLNGNDLDDIFFYGVDDYQGSASSVRTMQNSVLINQGNNEFRHPHNILDSNNKSVNDIISDDFLPIKKTKYGYMFFEFEKGIPPKFGTMYNLKFE